MSRPRLLDLFCGAGGAAMGYYRAGLEIVGVDLHPQPRYPFEFVQADALEYLDDLLYGGRLALMQYDAIHASPPCQAYSRLRTIHKREHPDLIAPVRERLKRTGLPWVIENVPGSPLRADVMLCGSTFGLGANGRVLHRHRYFETSWPLAALVPPCDHRGRAAVGVYGGGEWDDRRNGRTGAYQAGAAESREVMGIEWMTKAELSQAIPPAMTEWIGAHLPIRTSTSEPLRISREGDAVNGPTPLREKGDAPAPV